MFPEICFTSSSININKVQSTTIGCDIFNDNIRFTFNPFKRLKCLAAKSTLSKSSSSCNNRFLFSLIADILGYLMPSNSFRNLPLLANICSISNRAWFCSCSSVNWMCSYIKIRFCHYNISSDNNSQLATHSPCGSDTSQNINSVANNSLSCLPEAQLDACLIASSHS